MAVTVTGRQLLGCSHLLIVVADAWAAVPLAIIATLANLLNYLAYKTSLCSLAEVMLGTHNPHTHIASLHTDPVGHPA